FEPLLAQVRDPPLPARRQPERLAVRVVEVAAETARAGGACEHELDGSPHRRTLVEPRQRRPEERELWTAVADHDDARPLVRVPLPDDKLVPASGGGEPRRRGPVDRPDVVPGPVGTGAGYLRAAAAAHTPHRPVRQPQQAA